jgi:acyl dehydratase
MSLRIGDAPADLTDAPVSRTDIVRYQGASGDLNPIHHDDGFARAAGYDSVFSVGMLQAGVLAGHATGWLGTANLRRFYARFLEQVWPGDVLTYRAEVAEVRRDEQGTLVDLALTATRQDGGVHIRGEATFRLDDGASS